MKSFEINSILVPVDFSETSLTALDHAVKLAEITGGEITLVHVVESILSTADPNYFTFVRSAEYETDIMQMSRKHLDQLIAARNTDGKIRMKAINSTGRTHTEIVRISKEIDADLIVMGTHGTSGFRELIMGSNTFRVVSDADCPVLSIRYDRKTTGFKNILLPFNDEPHSREKVNHAIKMARVYGATLNILGIDHEDDPDHYKKIELEAKQICTIATKNDVKCKVDVISEGYFASVLIKYAEHMEADLIIEMRGMDRLSITEYFMEPFSEQMINHSPIPVLSVKSTFNTDTVDLRFY